MGRGGRKQLWVGAGIAFAVVLVSGLVWFKPWALWVDETVTEGLPSTVPAAPRPSHAPSAGVSTAPSPSGPTTLAQGTFISHEHTTTGAVKLLRLEDGTHALRLEGLDTSNGPDLRVWLTDAPVKEGKAGWGVFDDGKYVSLGKLKGNKGDQNYVLPADVDVPAYTSVSIWCDRFDVSFGAAELVRA
ncbi:DM13 domain-containing protein [Streptomyces changanensis]|uniref:DM13 domain-containing protein n=1 Tax=Streptomyces changanensis TaxID=2964669 RepID=A0ABY5MYV3_9ACTN|nr:MULTISPECIES: DM13 domain-containing protein [Streptomyces]UUS29480.1 DM13 domain-containing protein [Streptomyces changanensis]